jgi:hypothetical protein
MGRLGCSAFAVSGQRTIDDGLLCGRNLDYFVSSAAGDDVWAATSYMREHLAVIEFAPRDGASFVSVGWPGFIGAATAMNERGLIAGGLTVQTLRNLVVGTPSTLLYRRVMEECASLNEAIHLLSRARRTQGNNVLLGSAAEGSAAIVEYTPWRFAVRRARDGFVAATNHFNHPDMLRHHSNLVFQSSAERLARLGEIEGDLGSRRLDAEGVAAMLVDTERRCAEANEYCTVLNPCTLYSVVFEPSQCRLWLRPADRPERRFQSVGLR